MTTAPVLRLDPDLGAGIPEPRRSGAIRVCRAEVIDLPLGGWDPQAAGFDRDGFGLLLLSGIICRRVVQGESYGAELLGPGDVLRPWDKVGEWSSIPTDSSWTVVQEAELAVLDQGFARRASPYPEIAAQLLRRGLIRSRYLTILLAIIGQRRIETRLTMLFWHLADRFGQMRGEWVHIPVPVTHSILAELVAARRPSVTTALSALQERGVIVRERDGWLLRGSVPAELLAVDGPPEPAETAGPAAAPL